MASGPIRRTARRGIAAAVLAWMGVATASVLMAPSAVAAPSATVEIRNVTPPAASVDKGGTVTFVNKIPAQNKGGIVIPGVPPLTKDITASATVHTDVAVTFFGQKRPLQTNQSASWKFDDAATRGTIAYSYRIVPQAGLPASVATQVVNKVAASLPELPAPIPYVVQTIAPDLPQLPSVNLPQLPQVEVPVPTAPAPPPAPAAGAEEQPTPPSPPPPAPPALPPMEGSPYQYDTQGPIGLSPAARSAAAAFDPSRFAASGSSSEGSGSAASNGAGGAPGGYDGASVPVFGQLAGLSDPALDEEGVEEASAARSENPALPAAALAAVVALATVTAALVRTHQAHRVSPARHAAR